MPGCLRSIGGVVGLLFVLLALVVVFDSALRVVLAVVALLGGWLAWSCGAALVGRAVRPRVTVRPDVLKPGDTFAVACASPAGAQVRLICRESSRRKAGNGREVTDTHDWVVDDVRAERGAELQMTIPTNAMHSFATRHHEILWLVEARPAGQRGQSVGLAGRAELTVLPVPYSP